MFILFVLHKKGKNKNKRQKESIHFFNKYRVFYINSGSDYLLLKDRKRKNLHEWFLHEF